MGCHAFKDKSHHHVFPCSAFHGFGERLTVAASCLQCVVGTLKVMPAAEVGFCYWLRVSSQSPCLDRGSAQEEPLETQGRRGD